MVAVAEPTADMALAQVMVVLVVAVEDLAPLAELEIHLRLLHLKETTAVTAIQAELAQVAAVPPPQELILVQVVLVVMEQVIHILGLL